MTSVSVCLGQGSAVRGGQRVPLDASSWTTLWRRQTWPRRPRRRTSSARHCPSSCLRHRTRTWRAAPTRDRRPTTRLPRCPGTVMALRCAAWTICRHPSLYRSRLHQPCMPANSRRATRPRPTRTPHSTIPASELWAGRWVKVRDYNLQYLLATDRVFLLKFGHFPLLNLRWDNSDTFRWKVGKFILSLKKVELELFSLSFNPCHLLHIGHRAVMDGSACRNRRYGMSGWVTGIYISLGLLPAATHSESVTHFLVNVVGLVLPSPRLGSPLTEDAGRKHGTVEWSAVLWSVVVREWSSLSDIHVGLSASLARIYRRNKLYM